MRPAIRLRVAHLRGGGPTRDQKAVRTIYIYIYIYYIYTDSEIIVLTRWGSLRLAPIMESVDSISRDERDFH